MGPPAIAVASADEFFAVEAWRQANGSYNSGGLEPIGLRSFGSRDRQSAEASAASADRRAQRSRLQPRAVSQNCNTILKSLRVPLANEMASKKTLGFDSRIHKGGPAEDSMEEGGRTQPTPAHDRSLSRRAPLLWLVLPFMAGLADGRSWLLPRRRQFLSPPLRPALRSRLGSPCGVLHLGAVALLAAMASAGYASYVLHYSRLSSWDDRPEREAVLEMRIERVFFPRLGPLGSPVSRS